MEFYNRWPGKNLPLLLHLKNEANILNQTIQAKNYRFIDSMNLAPTNA